MGRSKAFPGCCPMRQPHRSGTCPQNQSGDGWAAYCRSGERAGCAPFDRNQTGYELTESGKAIRIKAEHVEAAVLTVEQEALGRDLRTSGKVRVATTDDIATLIVAPNLREFSHRFPGISLEIIARQEVANLSRREAEVALRPLRPRQANLLVRQVGVWNLGLYAAQKYAEAHDLRPGQRDFSKVATIGWTKEGAGLRSAPWLDKKASGSVVALAASSRRIQHAACKAGIGVAILPCLAADHDPDLVCLLPPDQVISVPLWLVVHRDLARTARVRAVMEFLSEASSKAAHRGTPIVQGHSRVLNGNGLFRDDRPCRRQRREDFRAGATRQRRICIEHDALEQAERAFGFDRESRRHRDHEALQRIAIGRKPPVQRALHPGGDEPVLADAAERVADFVGRSARRHRRGCARA